MMPKKKLKKGTKIAVVKSKTNKARVRLKQKPQSYPHFGRKKTSYRFVGL